VTSLTEKIFHFWKLFVVPVSASLGIEPFRALQGPAQQHLFLRRFLKKKADPL
jgi:hypothetical protein